MAGAAETRHARRLLLFGPPGAGKGTQAALLAERLGVPAISTGEMFRQAVAGKSELGRKVEAILARGELVDDATTADIVRARLAEADARPGFLLDGYPRNLAQAATLEEILRQRGESLDAAVFLEVPAEELVRRMSGRAQECGRSDDRPAVVRERLRIYEQKTAPLVEYYRQRCLLRQIDGHRAVEAVADAVLAALQPAAAAAACAARETAGSLA
ncbi:MAG TPA: adenylate kinase [Thermoanaerobaculia bacterium]|nr:adenylate kinase [Thermoanaerobaculia bacterium]